MAITKLKVAHAIFHRITDARPIQCTAPISDTLIFKKKEEQLKLKKIFTTTLLNIFNASYL